MASCGLANGTTTGVCYVKNDGHLAFAGTLNITTISFKTGAEAVLHAQPLNLAQPRSTSQLAGNRAVTQNASG